MQNTVYYHNYNSSCSNMKSPCNQKFKTISQIYLEQTTLLQYPTTYFASFSPKLALT